MTNSTKTASGTTRTSGDSKTQRDHPCEELGLHDLHESATEDEWEDDGINTDWPVEEILDHFVDTSTGEISYKLGWENWKRKKDNSNTTWVRPDGEVPERLEKDYMAKVRGARHKSRLDFGKNVPEAYMHHIPWLSRATVASRFISRPVRDDLRPARDYGWKSAMAQVSTRSGDTRSAIPCRPGSIIQVAPEGQPHMEKPEETMDVDQPTG